MSEGVLFALSNSSLDIYPGNTRSSYTNRLPATISVSKIGVSGLWLSLESLAIENSIIPYKKSVDPDIITYEEIDISHNKFQSYEEFFMPERWFENSRTFISFLQRECLSLFFKNVYLKNNAVVIHTNGRKTLVSERFLRFLGFTEYNTVNKIFKLGSVYFDSRLEKFYKSYYIIEIGSQYNTLIANHILDLNIFKPRILKVVTPSIKEYICGGTYKNVLSVIPLDHSKSALTFIPRIKQYFRANSDFISNIVIHFLDESDAPINFAVGPPTIVKVRFKEMDTNTSTFHIQISNLDSNNIYVENHYSSFVSKLPKSIQLKDKWYVALSRIYLPPKILNITRHMNIIEFVIEPIEKSKKSMTRVLKIRLPPTFCSSIAELLTVLNNSMLESRLEFLNYKGKIQCIYNRKSHSNEQYKLKLHKKLAGILGYRQDKLVENITDEFIIIPFSIDNEINNPSPRTQYLFEDEPNLEHSIPPWIFVYCDLVKPSIMGHTSVPLLKIIPIEYKSVQNLAGRYYEFDTLEYYELGNNWFQSISFHLRTHDGYFISFEEGASVQLTLSFSQSI